ncbi:MAG: cadherin-like beta sandwich domain-containing protein, partial [Bacteroidales bacterium]|nr:cadherin-like beta sandwich domain-containing protein [Bacteroidales bacterium]
VVSASNPFGFAVTQDTILKATFAPINYSIIYHTTGGAVIPDGSYTVESATVTLPEPTKEGYTFGGWYANADLSTGGAVTAIPAGSTGNKAYWAKWKSADATLSGIDLSAGTLSPAFSAGVTEYAVHVPYGVGSITVTGVANHSGATVTGNVTDQPLATGDNVIEITVTAEDGITTMTYTVTVSRDEHVPVTEANLVSLTVNGRTVAITGYELAYVADCGESSLMLDFEVSPYAKVTVNGASYLAGTGIPLTGDVTTVAIRVTAETGGAVNNYTLTVGAPINESRLYYQRWDDVLAVNLNPANNGGYRISDVRWYRQDGASLGNADYILISGPAAGYYAEVEIDGAWRRACNSSGIQPQGRVIACPNPVPQGASVKLQSLPEEFAGGTVRISNMRGMPVKADLLLPTTISSIDVSDLVPGIYLLHVTAKDGSREVIKIVVE